MNRRVDTLDDVNDTVRVRLDLAYDGGEFHGWAAQPGLRTVEGVLSAGIERIARLPIRLVVAGRTDTGVHAAAQVAHLDMPRSTWLALPGRGVGARSGLGGHGEETANAALGASPGLGVSSAPEASAGQGTASGALVRRLAGVLPPDLVVRAASLAPPGFDARFSATSRTYRYRICDAFERRDPATRAVTLWLARPLDTAAMGRAAGALLGEHDFAAYCKPRDGATTIRTLVRLDVARVAPGRVEIWVSADAFCHNMVRALVGTLIDVGVGRRDEGHPGRVLSSRERAGAGAVVAPHGLTLEGVEYPPDELLAARAAAARRRRDEPGPGDAAPEPGW